VGNGKKTTEPLSFFFVRMESTLIKGGCRAALEKAGDAQTDMKGVLESILEQIGSGSSILDLVSIGLRLAPGTY